MVVAAVLVGLGVRRGKGQTAGDSAVHYYSTPGLGLAAAEGGGEGRKKESVATDYYEDMGQGGGGEGKESVVTEYYEDMGGGGECMKESAVTEYYEDMGVGGEGKKESAVTEYYEDMGGGGEGKKESAATGYYVNEVVADLARGSAYEAPWRGASRPDNQPTERVPGRDYTDLNMDTVSKREYESLHKTT